MMSLTPLKSTTTKWSIGSPVTCLTSLIVQAGPPIVNASLNLPWKPPLLPPLLVLHIGSVTQVSRGMLITSARLRPSYRCTSITTSDCAVL